MEKTRKKEKPLSFSVQPDSEEIEILRRLKEAVGMPYREAVRRGLKLLDEKMSQSTATQDKSG